MEKKKRGWPKLPIVQMTMTCVQLFQRHFNNSIFSTYITIGVKSLFNFLMYENPSSAGHKNISSTSKSGKNVYLHIKHLEQKHFLVGKIAV